jgi:four helix bundle protein
MRRAAVSIIANIAEGFRRRASPIKSVFEHLAGSLEESRCFLFLCRDLDYGDTAVLLKSLEEVSKLLDNYSKAILGSDS